MDPPPSGEDPEPMEILGLSSSDDEEEHPKTTPKPNLTLGSVFAAFPTLKSGIKS